MKRARLTYEVEDAATLHMTCSQKNKRASSRPLYYARFRFCPHGSTAKYR